MSLLDIFRSERKPIENLRYTPAPPATEESAIASQLYGNQQLPNQSPNVVPQFNANGQPVIPQNTNVAPQSINNQPANINNQPASVNNASTQHVRKPTSYFTATPDQATAARNEWLANNSRINAIPQGQVSIPQHGTTELANYTVGGTTGVSGGQRPAPTFAEVQQKAQESLYQSQKGALLEKTAKDEETKTEIENIDSGGDKNIEAIRNAGLTVANKTVDADKGAERQLSNFEQKLKDGTNAAIAGRTTPPNLGAFETRTPEQVEADAKKASERPRVELVDGKPKVINTPKITTTDNAEGEPVPEEGSDEEKPELPKGYNVAEISAMWDEDPLTKAEAVNRAANDKGFLESMKGLTQDPDFYRNLMKFGITTMAAASVPGANTFGAVAAGLQAGLQDYIEQPDKKNATKLFEKFAESGLFSPEDYKNAMASDKPYEAMLQLINDRTKEKSISEAEAAGEVAETEHLRALELKEYEHQLEMRLAEKEAELDAANPKKGDKDGDGDGDPLGSVGEQFKNAQGAITMYEDAINDIRSLSSLSPEEIDERAGYFQDFITSKTGLNLGQEAADIQGQFMELQYTFQYLGKELVGPGLGQITDAEWKILGGLIENINLGQSPEQIKKQLVEAETKLLAMLQQKKADVAAWVGQNPEAAEFYARQGVQVGSVVPESSGDVYTGGGGKTY